MGILNKTKVYTIGHMQYADGQGWRNYVKEELNPLGITVFDPYKKPFIDDAPEDTETRNALVAGMENEDYGHIHNHMKQVRAHDLNLCDRSDFIIGHIIPSIASWGTAEELVTSVKMKKAIFLSIDGGKKKTPLWIMGMIPHKYIYNSIEDVVAMIKKIDSEKVKIDSDRWRLLREEYR